MLGVWCAKEIAPKKYITFRDEKIGFETAFIEPMLGHVEPIGVNVGAIGKT